MLLPDVNIWLALTFEAHVHHQVASNWFDQIGEQPCRFCRLTQQGFLRLATNANALGNDAVGLDDAWTLYDSIVSDDRIGLADEPAGIEPVWRQFTHGSHFSTKVWSDAYLAAFASTGGYTFITCDKGFANFDRLNWVHLG